MQGQRGTINSFPETFDFDHGSSSSNNGVDQQIIWNVRNRVENRLPDYMLSPSESNIAYSNAVAHDGLSLSSWNLGESSSSDTMRSHVTQDDIKAEHGWSSSLGARAVAGSTLQEERRYEPANIHSLETVNISLSSNQVENGPIFLQSSTSDGTPRNLNSSFGHVNNSTSGGQFMGTGVCPHPYKSGGSESQLISSASGSSAPFGVNSESAGYLVEENDGRPGCSLDGRRLSCKRKAIEGASGQSSLSGSSSCLQQAENNQLHTFPDHHNGGRRLSICTPSENPSNFSGQEQMNPRLGVDIRGVALDSLPPSGVAATADGSHRNFRMRINHAYQQDFVPPSLLPTGSALSNSNVWSSDQSSTYLPFDNSFDSVLTAAAVNSGTQTQSRVVQVAGLPRNLQSFQWNGTSNSRSGSSSSSPVVSEEIAVALQEEANARSLPRNISEHPMFVPSSEMRNSARDPASLSLSNGNISIPGHVASTSRIGSSSSVHPLSAPNRVPHHNRPIQYPRRLSELVRHSLLPSMGPESRGQSSSFPPLRSGPSASSQEMVLSSGAGPPGHHQPYLRSALWMERQGDNVIGAPYSLRALGAASEGRSRLVTEIRNVLDIMRRSDSLRFEDVVVLDHSVFYGMADLHDRHRDMRLDVDNMSYEELLALEERIGNVSTGLSEESILKCLQQQKYCSITKGAPSEVEPCCICQEEYIDGEDTGVLDCGHDFHTACIKQWLMHKNLCPICKTTALVT